MIQRLLPLLMTGFLCFSHARENPFKPLINETVLPVTSNKVEKKPPFRKAKIQLPVDARILTSIVVYYQSIDGSIKKETLPVDRSIDWHIPLLISQELPTAKQRKKPSPNSMQKRGEKAKIKRQTADKSYPLIFAPLPFVKVSIEGKNIHIITKDRKIRSFHINPPFKIALDFKRDARFLTKHKRIDKPPVKAIDIGNHRGYYRVVVTFDAPYRYTLVKRDDGYLVKLR